jgi:phosphatidate cytidylyltransferase
MNDANRNLLLRIASAAVLVPPLVFLILWQRHEGFAIAVHLAAALALLEFYGIALAETAWPTRILAALGGAALSSTIYWCPHGPALVILMMALTMGLATLELLTFKDIKKAADHLALFGFGLLYVPLLLTPLALLKRLPEGSDWLFLVFTITFFSDTGAYFAGRFLGRKKLYPAVSPGKTWAGAMGGLAAALGAAVIAKFWYMPQLGWIDVFALSIPGSALGQIGDLVESLIKRSYGVKDSGKMIPGHGGLLDRIDALLFVSSYVFIYVTLVLR